jgi:hypothetical protein
VNDSMAFSICIAITLGALSVSLAISFGLRAIEKAIRAEKEGKHAS